MRTTILALAFLVMSKIITAQSLGGVDLSRFVYGDNTTKTSYFNDPNDAIPSGFYNQYTGTNMPYQSWWHLINNRHVNENNNYQFQLAADFWGDNTYFRKISGSTPIPWRRILNDGQDVYAANLNQYLRTTDNVSFNNLSISTNQSVNGFLQFPHAYGDANDGKICSSIFQPGLDIVGINNDNTYRKIQLWGQIIQNQNNGTNLWSGTNFFDGNVGIGTSSPTERLCVNGNIKTKKLIVTQTGWADYVFKPTYKLKSLNEVEQYIKIHQHLPEVPSQKEVKENGVDIGDTQVLLLKKIEELTLYMIDQQKQIVAQSRQIEILQKQNQQLIKRFKSN